MVKPSAQKEEEGPAPEESVQVTKQQDVYQQYYELLSSSFEEATMHLAGVLDLPDYESNPRSAARLDFISYALQFAREACYGPRRVNALISIASCILEATIAGASSAEVQATFQTRLLAATSPRPGADSEQFSPDQVAQVAQYFARTFFRHFRLYSYLYSTPQDIIESNASLLVETALVPSFGDALSESEWLDALDAKRMAEEAAAAEAKQAEEAAKEAAAAKAAEEAAMRAEEQRQADLQVNLPL
ncbi:flagellar C1a complex subunit C1a-32-domain-containing protein [Dunaliella salina]|uniref:Flagellar C1a complex subunit C1a-32-domain-containing protein n=1 Tax=Dunaliella salina TaxID=3046 RepID=A0ABQ7FZ97_DUNSA|nr:flagellar C1a complex subunit C1a-32-domain-containing protein [Dunaliella salina]|eukprot:KAF5827682.1 flagellar C1a complex subunit C1a-32-domain-containing protein [Dunaliella salina]